MKKLVFSVFLFLVFFSSVTHSQTQRSDYKKLDYIHVDRDQADQFLEIANEVMKPAYQQMVDSGAIKSWKLYIVDYPGGQRNNYNFVCVVTAPAIKTFEENFSKMGSSHLMPVSGDQNEADNLASLTKLMASEIWRVRSVLFEDAPAAPASKFLMMDYMKVAEGRGPAYLTLEDEVAMPLHRQRAKNDRMAGWEVYSLVLPGGTEYGYNYATGNFFDHITHLEFGFTQELIQQTLPGTDVTELLNTIYETRDLVKSELWELVAHTGN